MIYMGVPEKCGKQEGAGVKAKTVTSL